MIVVRPLRVIKFVASLKIFKSGCLAYVTSNALPTDESTNSINDLAPLGLNWLMSEVSLRRSPLPTVSIRSTFHSRLTNLSSSLKKLTLRTINSCSLLGVFKTSTPLSSCVATLSSTPPVGPLVCFLISFN